MRYLILSDIHANWEALQAVRAHVRRKRFDRVAFLGDAVGYGASPNQVLAWLRSLGSALDVVRGNHDRVCAGLDSAEYFNRYAREAATWTLEHVEERRDEYRHADAVIALAGSEDPNEIADQVLEDLREVASCAI